MVIDDVLNLGGVILVRKLFVVESGELWIYDVWVWWWRNLGLIYLISWGLVKVKWNDLLLFWF